MKRKKKEDSLFPPDSNSKKKRKKSRTSEGRANKWITPVAQRASDKYSKTKKN